MNWKLLGVFLIAALLIFGCTQQGAPQATTAPTSAPVVTTAPTKAPTAAATKTPTVKATAEPSEAVESPQATQEATSAPIATATPAPTSSVQKYTVEVDDNGWYPNTLTLKKGVPAELTVTMRTKEVYFAGGDIKSDQLGTTRLMPGESHVFTFTPTAGFQISNYWPSAGVFKGSITIAAN